MYENLIYDTRDSIAVITINRPAVRNALNSATVRELAAAFEQARADAAVRVVILSGAGDKAFVAGADINELAVQSPEFDRRPIVIASNFSKIFSRRDLITTLDPRDRTLIRYSRLWRCVPFRSLPYY